MTERVRTYAPQPNRKAAAERRRQREAETEAVADAVAADADDASREELEAADKILAEIDRVLRGA